MPSVSDVFVNETTSTNEAFLKQTHAQKKLFCLRTKLMGLGRVQDEPTSGLDSHTAESVVSTCPAGPWLGIERVLVCMILGHQKNVEFLPAKQRKLKFSCSVGSANA